jgi:hypothetical protein
MSNTGRFFMYRTCGNTIEGFMITEMQLSLNKCDEGLEFVIYAMFIECRSYAEGLIAILLVGFMKVNLYLSAVLSTLVG